MYSLLALNLVRQPCPAPEDPQRTHPWRDTVKSKVREEQEKEEVWALPSLAQALRGHPRASRMGAPVRVSG